MAQGWGLAAVEVAPDEAVGLSGQPSRTLAALIVSRRNVPNAFAHVPPFMYSCCTCSSKERALYLSRLCFEFSTSYLYISGVLRLCWCLCAMFDAEGP